MTIAMSTLVKSYLLKNAMLDFTGVLSPACSAHPLWGFGWRLGGKSDFCLMRFFFAERHPL